MENINNTPVQEPENTVETKKKKLNIKLEKHEIFMILAVVVANGAVPVITSFISAVFSFIEPLILEIPLLWRILSSLTYSAETILTAVLSFAVVILFAFLAYKKNRIRNGALFLGVFFASQSVSHVLIENPVSRILNFIVDFLNTAAYDMTLTVYGADYDMYRAVTAVTGIVNSTLQFVIDFVCLILTAVLAVAVLRIINGKLRIKFNFKKKKKKETEEAQAEEIQENA